MTERATTEKGSPFFVGVNKRISLEEDTMPLHNQNHALYEVDLSVSPPSCLPTGTDKTKLRDVTLVGDTWRRYLDLETGKVHDGAEYYEKSRP